MGPANQYEGAIYQVGKILENYDADRQFPTFGFGGIPRHMNSNTTSHCFPLNGNVNDPGINGIDMIVGTYRQFLPQIGLSGPTYFAPILKAFLEVSKGGMATNTYNVLLLLTDGEIHDMPETQKLIVEMSTLPCSVIIVGVGNEAFRNMEVLDGDGERL